MAKNGEQRFLGVVHHIAKSVERRNDTNADGILQIFSDFNRGFSCEKLEHTLNSLELQISQFVAADQPIWSNAANSSSFLDVIDELMGTIRIWSPMAGDKNIEMGMARADDLMQQAMFRVEDELRFVMERGSEGFEDEEDEAAVGVVISDGEDHRILSANHITDYDIVIDALPPSTINDLHEIAKRMVILGFGKDFSHVYSSCRREFLEESLIRLGLQKLSSEEIHEMPWQELEDKIDRWNKAVNVAVRILFPSERILCDQIFFGFSSAADFSFMEVCRGSMIQLLNFADALAIGLQAPARMFKLLDVVETWRGLMPEFELVFCDQYCLILRNKAISIWKRLGETIRGIFIEWESLIRHDLAKTVIPGGGVHPITRYVTNYFRAVCVSRQTLEQIFEDDQTSSSSLSVQIVWIVEVLESNLKEKSKIYRDPALRSVFMMNNGMYIVQKVKDSELGSLLGDDWIRKQSAKIRQYHVKYVRSSWNKVIAVFAPNSGANSIEEKLKLFNQLFDETCKVQSTWAMFDEQVRDELKMSVAGYLLTAYWSFIARFSNVPGVGRLSENDIDTGISKLFQGNGDSPVDRK